MVGLPRAEPRGMLVCPSTYSRRPSTARRPRLDDDLYEEDRPFDYSGLTVYPDDCPRFEDTGLVFPDGEPIYREVGAPLGFPIVPQD